MAHDSLPPQLAEAVAAARRRFAAGLQAEAVTPDRVGILLAAGAATRLRPLTASARVAGRDRLDPPDAFGVTSWNKAALPVLNRPLVHFAVQDLVESGFRFLIANLSEVYAPEAVVAALGDGSAFGPSVFLMYQVEPTPLGTLGGAIGMLQTIEGIRQLDDEADVAVFSADIFTTQPAWELLRAHRARRAGFSIMVNEVPWHQRGEFGTVILDPEQRVVRFAEKDPDSPSNLNNSSRYLVKRHLLASWAQRLTAVPADKSEHRDPAVFFDFGLHLFGRELAELQQAGFYATPSQHRWIDLGRLADYREANIALLRERAVNAVDAGTQLRAVTLRGQWALDRDVVIEDATIEDCVIGRGWSVRGSRLSGVVLMALPDGVRFSVDNCDLEGVVVGSGELSRAELKDRVVVYNGSRLVTLPI